MKRIGIWSILLLLAVSSATVGEDTCFIESDQDTDTFMTFTAPVIPPSDTVSGEFVYLALFRPTGQNLWEGNVVKLGLDEEGNFVDANGDLALDSKGVLRLDAQPFWAARDWADPSESNYVHNSNRKIYTFLGVSKDLRDSSNEFKDTNPMITAPLLGDPSHSVPEIINFVRGADVFDTDGDGQTDENRPFILGDVMHSTPLVLTYRYPDNRSETYIFFGANDGMLHAVLDTETLWNGNITTHGEETWAFIPPDQLHRLKDLVEGDGHSYFVDSSPKAVVIDNNGDGILDRDDGDKAILVCGERQGGTCYFALDITEPNNPKFMWRVSPANDTGPLNLPSGAAPDVIIPELGETWSEPVFGKVKTYDEDTQGTLVFFIGAGYSPDDGSGKAIIAINVFDGSVVRRFKNTTNELAGMDFSIASTVAAIDENQNGFIDKLYVGDTGGQLWRVGRFTDEQGEPLAFPTSNENISTWKAHRLFVAPYPPRRSFFYPPSVVFENGYDLILTGTGNRYNPCDPDSADRIYAVKDIHDNTTLTENDLVDVSELQGGTSPPTLPNLDDETADVDDNGHIDRGWFIRLASGEKILEKGIVFNKVYYVTTFSPNASSGVSTLYAINYKTGAPALFGSEGNDTWGQAMGVGIPSRPIVYIGRSRFKLFASVGTSDLAGSGSSSSPIPGVAILEIQPIAPPSNLFYLWWMVL